MDGLNIRTEYVSLPASVKGFTVQFDDESFGVFLNRCLSYEQNKKTFMHELDHIRSGDFESENNAGSIENLRHSKEGG